MVYGIISSIIRSVKAKKKQGKKPPIKGETKLAEDSAEKSADEQFDSIVRKMEAQKTASNANRDEKQRAKNQRNDGRFRYDSRKSVSSSDDTGSQHKSETVKTPERELHVHPGERVGVGEKVRVEKKPVSTGSLGADNDEGCEHNDLRYVLDDVSSSDEDARGDQKEFQRLIVWGEILDTPRSRSKKIR